MKKRAFWKAIRAVALALLSAALVAASSYYALFYALHMGLWPFVAATLLTIVFVVLAAYRIMWAITHSIHYYRVYSRFGR